MNPTTLHAQILTLRKYQAWRTGEDTRTMDDAGIVPAAVTSALDAVLEIAENHLRGDTKQAEPSGYAYRYSDHSGGTVLRFNNGGEVNGARPIEAVPYWFAPPNATTVTCQLYGHPLHVCAECNHDLAAPSSVPVSKAGAVGKAFDLARRLKEGDDAEDELRHTIRQIAAMSDPVSVPTDEEIDAVFNAMPNGVQGWLVDWGYRQFARALLAKYGREAEPPTERIGSLVSWLRRREDWPAVGITGSMAKEIADILENKS